MTIIPNYIIAGILAIVFGILVAAWAGVYVERRMGGVMLILLSITMLLVGAGVFPPFFGMAAGIMGVILNRNTGKSSYDRSKVFPFKQHVQSQGGVNQ